MPWTRQSGGSSNHREGDERLRRTYRRNTVVMVLSLVLALVALLLSRFWGPIRSFLSSPASSGLERVLLEEMPECEFSVQLEGEGRIRLLSVTAESPQRIDDPQRFLARIEAIIYDNQPLDSGEVVIRVYERLHDSPSEPLALVTLSRTNIESIRERVGGESR